MNKEDLKDGMWIEIDKPKNVDECPFWVESIDKYDGEVFKISRTPNHILDYVYVEGIDDHCFNQHWLTEVEDPSSKVSKVSTGVTKFDTSKKYKCTDVKGYLSVSTSNKSYIENHFAPDLILNWEGLYIDEDGEVINEKDGGVILFDEFKYFSLVEEALPELVTLKEEITTTEWSSSHYNHMYKLTPADIEAGEVKIDAYFVNRMWKINSVDDTGAAFHILKTMPRLANEKNSFERELTAIYKQAKILCKMYGVVLDET